MNDALCCAMMRGDPIGAASLVYIVCACSVFDRGPGEVRGFDILTFLAGFDKGPGQNLTYFDSTLTDFDRF